ncbi:MAG: TetR/AcrR family transcriptional regulator [Acidobacteria bacterium]|nr:TetR/AcrR family transcriptional regulator [Acidobacteriota bacterium]MBW4044114.1 TetR/AcrR family transcriptional regulator [Acidobacteriota bacterium]
MPPRLKVPLEPRKSPVQARSVASVDAILEATIQVLLQVGKERLTTTRVALRAGVSVGTLYQYFPNKNALLQAALKRHLSEISDSIELVCRDHKGTTLRHMVTALMTAFLQAKMRDVKTSVALYYASSDVDGAKTVQQMRTRYDKAIVRMLASASEPLAVEPEIVASMLLGLMMGVSRRILESGSPEQYLEPLRREMIVMACAYLDACSAGSPIQDTPSVNESSRYTN